LDKSAFVKVVRPQWVDIIVKNAGYGKTIKHASSIIAINVAFVVLEKVSALTFSIAMDVICVYLSPSWIIIIVIERILTRIVQFVMRISSTLYILPLF
jgi:hypothetical protein